LEARLRGLRHEVGGRLAELPQGSEDHRHLSRLLGALPATRFEFHSITRGAIRTGARCLVVPTERTTLLLARFEARIAQTARPIAACTDTGDWPLAGPDGWWCAAGRCSYWTSCPAGSAGEPSTLRAAA
jgi:hypothetical protein